MFFIPLPTADHADLSLHSQRLAVIPLLLLGTYFRPDLAPLLKRNAITLEVIHSLDGNLVNKPPPPPHGKHGLCFTLFYNVSTLDRALP